eukprot:TRINITY_DN4658_c0_g3_i1.p2 TRINITY_DN4658_c0_g3~~TRINITY_DN4658_c0_g3_i1.p2  ORF type:complete len:344 (-),score=77.20 TRINITY_DN4658_c0_g3_i1:1309-2340(-)
MAYSVPSLATSGLAMSFHGFMLFLVVSGIINRTSTSRFAIKYKLDWSSNVALSQVFVIFMALMYTMLKVLQAVIGPNTDALCSTLCKLSALTFPLVDFCVYMFLRIRNEKSSVTGDDPKKLWFERILYSLTIITPCSAVVNAVLGGGKNINKVCVTTPNAYAALSIAGIEIFLNFGFLSLFILPLRKLARDRSALDLKRVQQITQRNFISCLLCVVGGVFTNSMAATVTLTSDATTKTNVSPLVSLGSIVMVIGVLFSTWKAWECQFLGIGKAQRIVDDNGDANSDAGGANNRNTRTTGFRKTNLGATGAVVNAGTAGQENSQHSVNQVTDVTGRTSQPMINE